MKKKQIIIISVIAIIVILIIINIIGIKKIEPREQNEEKIIANDKNLINEIKEEINATGDTNIYEVKKEYDGRKIIQIKPNIQFETALAGILKNAMFEEDEIETLLENKPKYNGIWISNNSREKFLELLEKNNIDNYIIDENGYLKLEKTNSNQQEENTIIENAIKSDNLYIIDITGTSYIRDEITGNITQYPFEKMDPYQILNTYDNENATILEITTNEKNKVSNKDILQEILQSIK